VGSVGSDRVGETGRRLQHVTVMKFKLYRVSFSSAPSEQDVSRVCCLLPLTTILLLTMLFLCLLSGAIYILN